MEIVSIAARSSLSISIKSAKKAAIVAEGITVSRRITFKERSSILKNREIIKDAINPRKIPKISLMELEKSAIFILLTGSLKLRFNPIVKSIIGIVKELKVKIKSFKTG